MKKIRFSLVWFYGIVGYNAKSSLYIYIKQIYMIYFIDNILKRAC